jgi:ElaB/YqjD/DUF883 family membrane-anchored ribosome-binding protein
LPFNHFLTQGVNMIASNTNQQNARQAADNLAHTADQAVDTTRSFANNALDATGRKIHNLNSSVKPTLEKFSRRAGEYANQGKDMAMQAKDKARESISHYSRATGRYVTDKPVQSVLIAAAVGAAVALLVSFARNRDGY